MVAGCCERREDEEPVEYEPAVDLHSLRATVLAVMSANLPSFATLLLVFAACTATPPRAEAIRVAHLESSAGTGFEALRTAFRGSNPGYDLEWHPRCRVLAATATHRVVFVQGPANRKEAPTVGDVLLLRAGERWVLDTGDAIDLLAFTLPTAIPAELPALIRPDWDPRITDTPGGCAEETGAYRRILLTWLPANGPYVLRELNAHRVRITDSFSHYHPEQGGFDEFYLVQMAPPGARLVTSEQVPAIESEQVRREDAGVLVQVRALHVGDLVYLPRGTMHRGLGGALVQVISVPGFVPNREIGLDHHLWAINTHLGLTGDEALPFQLVAARAAVVK